VWRDAATPEVALRGVDADTLRALVGAVYTRRLEVRPRAGVRACGAELASPAAPACLTPNNPCPCQVTPRTAAPMLAGAAQLALAAPLAAVTELLRARLCPASALATSALAHAHGQAELAAHADACAASHFSSLLRDDPAGVAALPAERVAALLASDALAVAAEADALRALLAWAASAAGGAPHESTASPRAHQLAALLPLVRLRLVPRTTLLEVRLCVCCIYARACVLVL
jgi:hypothetical protein